MPLSDLGLAAQGGRDVQITGLSVDSRAVKPGHLFAALPGVRAHGAEFVTYALRMGAAAVLTDAEIFGRYQHGRTQRLFKRVSRQRKASITDFNQFQPDDYVVHAEYGIGRFEDIEKRERNGVKEEVLVIEYAEESKLYVPLEHAHLVSRYVGVGKSAPVLSKLGSGRWIKVKKATEQAIMEYAGELLKLQASRQTYQGIVHSEDTKWQWEFENAFLYTETRDQLKAIHDTKTDMESAQPMDRLICGDVGFGKTEVAIRAAFKAVMSGYQVAMLCPTTVLAQQHYHNFCERMSDYPIRIEQLSRFRKPAEQRQVVNDLINGTVDIVIGTHRLISKDTAFKKLGLVIVDARRKATSGRAAIRSTRKPLHIWSPTAAVTARPIKAVMTAIGSWSSRHGTIRNTPGCSRTRGASSAGTTSDASPSRGTTSIVMRSNGIAS